MGSGLDARPDPIINLTKRKLFDKKDDETYTI